MSLVYRITNEVLRDLIRSEHEGNIINSCFSLVEAYRVIGASLLSPL